MISRRNLLVSSLPALAWAQREPPAPKPPAQPPAAQPPPVKPPAAQPPAAQPPAAQPSAAQPPRAQPPEDAAVTIRVDVDLVNLFCSVRDKDNRYIATLNKENFELFEEGKKQDLKAFSRESDLPLTIGLLVDVSKSQERLIEDERRASLKFFEQVLRPKDVAFVMSFGVDSELLQDFTSSTDLLRRGLESLRLNAGVPEVFTPSTLPSQRGGTVLYEAVWLACEDRLKGEVGRKAIIVISDGVDTGSKVKIEKAIEAAQRADAIIYGILYEDPMYTSPFMGGTSGEGALRRLAEDTGGRAFRVDRRRSLTDIYTEIQTEMRSQYALGYTSSNSNLPGGFRRVEIRTTDRKLKVQARKGYYATKS